jgi:hypothetical protein
LTEAREDPVIQALRNHINFLTAEVSHLKEENALLKASLARDLIESEKSYQDIKDKLDQQQGLILEVIIDLCRRNNAPVNYEQIIRGFRSRHPRIPLATETITRQVRKMAEPELGLLHRVKDGLFIPRSEGIVSYGSR